ncbi:acyltransferase [Massilia sp. CF038]|uniref:acyltransferase family protein n=1 Tax=Massilia sp. CF038 TaxID=1881045 RepID=UPI00091129BB|nr:acyltransferase [Massilia sp. CF038]SHG37805.1 Peptidoglycan/LPS O-acetylase OafA/YrhL, contains acyltransferase and SGNH-hydrolase domains [Massilia sp. CF038]
MFKFLHMAEMKKAFQWMAQRFELARHGDAANVRPMEGLRGFAVFLVFLVHYATLMAPWMRAHSPLAETWEWVHTVGNAGVDLFFVLSGYLIYGSLIARRQAYLPFLRRRIARIYPAFLVMFFTYLALSYLRPAESKIPEGFWPALTYILQNFLLLPGIFKIEPMITVAWSLSYEMLYYIVLPLVIAACGLREKSLAWRVSLFVMMGVLLLVGCTLTGGPIRLTMFIAGILLHEAIRSKARTPHAGLVAALTVCALAFTATPYLGPFAFMAKLMGLFFAFFLLCQVCFSQPQSWLGRLFSFTPLRWLGNMSYSYYLLHGLALKVIVMVLLIKAPGVKSDALFVFGMLPFVFVLTLVPPAILFLLVERPFSLVAKAGRPAPVAPQGNSA